MENDTLKKRVGLSILVTSSLSLTLFLFAPAFIYVHNKSEFFSRFFNLLPLQLAVCLLVIIILTALLTPFKGKHRQRSIALTMAISFLFWLQGTIIQWDYGVLTGISIQFNEKLLWGVIDITIWIVVLIVSWLGYRTVYKMVKYVAPIIILIQTVALVPLLMKKNNLTGNLSLHVDKTCKYVFSAKRNIIILVLDAFPADLFQEFINEEPDLKKTFKDFTFFRNCLGGFPSTKPSVPFILSGEYYDNSESFTKFHRRIYEANSLPKILKERGYRVHIYANANTIHLSQKVASNFVAKKPSIRTKLLDSATLIDISLFKHVPHFLKKYIYNHHHWLISSIIKGSQRPAAIIKKEKARVRRNSKKSNFRCRDLDFFWSLTHNLKVDKKVPTFKYYHIKGLHPPLRLGKNCSFHKELPFNRDYLKETARCLLKHVRECLDYFRSRGIYQNSMIFIMGDHGTGHFGITHINHAARDPSYQESQVNPHMQKVISGAIPLLLVKSFSSKEKDVLTISDSPVSLGDISKTVLESLGIPVRVPGRSIFKVKDTDPRLRRYMYYSGFKRGGGKYMETIEEYLVKGFAWFEYSWQKSGRIFPPKAK